MKPAVLMMFRDEADILAECLIHWYRLGIRDFYLCDNGSVDRSRFSVDTLVDFWDKEDLGVSVYIEFDPATDWPGKRIINTLKERAINEGCDWLFPADADEFIQLPYITHERATLEEWIMQYTIRPSWGELPYLNIIQDVDSGYYSEYWQEPQKKACGYISKDMMISMGNHLIEGMVPILGMGGAYYKHYPVRSYEQFKRKLTNYMIAFHQSPHQDHPHAQAYKVWAVEGERYILNRYNALMNKHEDVVAPRWL
jgi:hypothetical protein